MAVGLANAGAQIIVNDIDQNKLDAAIGIYPEQGIKCFGYVFDVTGEIAVTRGVKKIEKEVGPIDILSPSWLICPDFHCFNFTPINGLTKADTDNILFSCTKIQPTLR